MKLRQFKTVRERREAVKKETGQPLTAIGSSVLDDETASLRNCENMIGWTQIPLGVAGPVTISVPGGERSFLVPLATTEGALVASVSRGMRALRETGPVVTDVVMVGTTRGPVFRVDGLAGGRRLAQYITDNFVSLQASAESTSSHLTLLSADVTGAGRYRFLRFRFDTGDAMGMNMATIASERLCAHIANETGAKLVAVAGNYDTDKKPSWLNVIAGRGQTVHAEATIGKQVVKDVLKTTPDKIYETWLAKCAIGSAISGSMGANAHIANVIAAVFIATGQDPAHVTEASCGMTVVENTDDGIYMSVRLPGLMLGTVGGGTGLPTQREALELMGVLGGSHGENKELFGRIVAAAVLAGELSLLASLAEGTLARAHEKLARGKGAV